MISASEVSFHSAFLYLKNFLGETQDWEKKCFPASDSALWGNKTRLRLKLIITVFYSDQKCPSFPLKTPWTDNPSFIAPAYLKFALQEMGFSFLFFFSPYKELWFSQKIWIFWGYKKSRGSVGVKSFSIKRWRDCFYGPLSAIQQRRSLD